MELITLVERAIQGDATALNCLLTQHWRFVYTICLSQAGRAVQAEDLTQEVFVRVFRDLTELREPAKFLPWLRQVARNVCRMWRRRHRATPEPLDAVAEPEDLAAAARFRQSELAAIVRTLLAQLSPMSREVLALHYLAGYSEAELAVAWRGVPAAEARSAVRVTPGERRLLEEVLHAPLVWLMSLTNAALLAIQTGVLVFLYPLYLVQRGGVSPEIVGLLIGLNVLGRLLGLWVGGQASDRLGRMPVLIPGLLVYGGLLGSLIILTHPLWLGLWSLAMGATMGLVAGLPTALVGDQVPQRLHGVTIGWLRTATDTGQILGPLVMGALADAVHLSAPFLVAAALLSVIAWRCHQQAGASSAAPPPS